MKNRVADVAWHWLTGLVPGELKPAEFGWLVMPHEHSPLLARRRATLIVNRVRLISFLFAVLIPLWSAIDFLVFPFGLWSDLALMRAATCAACAALVAYRPNSRMLDAYRAIALLFAIPSLFDVTVHLLLAKYHPISIYGTIGAGYAFLPFALLAGLAIFPLTLLESAILAIPILILQFISGYLRSPALEWSSLVGTFWLLIAITGVSTLAGMSQLAFMIALVRQAVRDPLTGVFSRKSAEEMVELQFNIAGRHGAPMALGFIDLDHFKNVNDRFGHKAGDRVLIGMTDTVSRNLRRGDVLARWGGEEFLLIMPETERTEAEAAVERLRAVGFGTRPDGAPVTASIGIAERTADRTADWRTLVDLADRRMYRAKQSGRNRVYSMDGPAVPAQQA
jgi:diguanylate cyclase (GGDEF)-like protein